MDGMVERGFERVADAFAALLAADGGCGAACAVYRDGRPVVDLFGGMADRPARRPWTRDTMAPTFSTTKGVASIVFHHLVEAGALDPDQPVARYWPEFAQNGKGDIPVAWVLSHRAGLPEVDGELTFADVLAGEPVVRRLAGQAPAWPPGSAHGYHTRTFGWLLAELVRRATGRSIGTYLAQEIAGPLGIDFYIGLPEALEPRVARFDVLEPPPPADGPPGPGAMRGDDERWNSRAVHAAELPAANGIGDARSLARLYAACIGTVDDVRLLRDDTVERARAVRSSGMDRVLGVETTFGLGFALPPTSLPPAVGPRSFGHGGAGGSAAFADPDARLGFGFVPSGLRLGSSGDARVFPLVASVYACS